MLDRAADHLVRRNEMNSILSTQSSLNDILIIDDESFDARRLSAILHVNLGRNISVRVASTLAEAISHIKDATPDFIFLDDYLPPDLSALETIPAIRANGFAGPLAIVSEELDRPRSKALYNAGAFGCLNKEDMNSVAVTELIFQTGSQTQAA